MSDPSYGARHAGYSPLPASQLPGSVPAVVDVDPMLLPFQEGNLQTFPPTDSSSKLLGSYPRSHEREESSGSKSADSDGSLPRVLQISTYQPYFNVDTREVCDRIIQSFFINRGDFMDLTSHNPDLYGPFWICTTLVFVAVALGNYADYLSSNDSWQFNISKVNWAAGVFYGYTCILPLILYFFFNYIGASIGIVRLWCLYGYSLFVFIPASVLSIIPRETFRWLFIAMAGFVSTAFVTLNIKNHVASNEWSSIVVLGCLLLHCCLALTLKFVFFQ